MLTKMEQAWEEFDQAVKMEAKIAPAEKDDKPAMARIALKAVNKHLDLACQYEREGLIAGERHAA